MARNVNIGPELSSGPVLDSADVTPNDTAAFRHTRGLYVGVTGNIKVRHAQYAKDQTYSNVPVGLYPWSVDMVYSTGTTASSIVAQY